MRLVQLSVPDEQRDEIVGILRDQRFGYTVTKGAGDRDDYSVISVVVPADAVEHVLDDLEAAGYDRSTYTVSLDTEFASYEHVDEVQNQWAKTPNRLAPEALRSKAKDLRRNTRSYVWMMMLSAVVATAGLLTSSPAVVVGSMVIAPIVSPALTASVGAVRDDRDMFIDSVHMQAFGLGIAIVAATASGWLVKQLHVVPVALAIEQMELVSLRLSPSMLSVVVGLAAGAAGAYGLATTGQTSILGVMIAAALIPTAAAVGIGVAWGNLVVAVGALILLVLSLIAVNVGGSAMLFYLDYRPDEVDEGILSVNDLRGTLIVGGTILFVVVTVAVVGVAFYQQSTFERTVNEATTDVLSQRTYDGLDASSLSIEYTAPLLSESTVVSITLVRTTDRKYPNLPDVLDRRITELTGREVTVEVQYLDYHRSGARPRTRATVERDLPPLGQSH